MIISISFILIAFIWLMVESRCFTIKLLQYSKPIICENKPIESSSNEIAQPDEINNDNDEINAVYEPHKKPIALLSPAILYKPSEFQSMPMPELSGKVNIYFKGGDN